MAKLHVVIGAGPLAQSVVRELLTTENSRVRVVSRRGLRGSLPADVETLAVNAYDANAVHEVARGAAVVYQCAQPPYREWAESFPLLQRAIVEGTARAGAKLVVGDNVYMYGPTHGQPLHEALPHLATGTKGGTRARMAAELMEAHVAGKVRVAVARASDFYGEAVLRSTIGEIVFAELLRGRPARAIGNVDLPHTMTYVGDFGRAMVILGEHDAALGQVWHVPSAEPTMTVRQLVERVAGDAGCAPRVTVLKGRLLALVSIFHPMLRELRELRYQVEEPFILDHSKFVSTFGDIATPVDVAIRRTVAWYRRSYRGCQSSPSESSESASAHEETPASTA